VHERLFPFWIALVDADRLISGRVEAPQRVIEARHFEGEVMRPRAVPVEEATEEVVVLDAVGLEDLHLHAVGEADLARRESGAETAGDPRTAEITGVAREGLPVLLHRDGDMIEHDGFRHGRHAYHGPTLTVMDFRSHSVTDLAELVRGGEVKATELVAAALDRIDKTNRTINAFVAVDAEGAMSAAEALETRRRRGEDLGALAGVPIGVKDEQDAAGLPTTHGSVMRAGAPPAVHDSSLVARLKDAGCIVVGKTNTSEFGWYAQTDNPLFGPTRNPWNLEHTPGGSSGGSAAAVAAGMVPLATGADGGGSIRIPAALCGFSGFKPSLGRVPGGGTAPPGWGYLSSPGPMARTTADTAAALDVVIGPDPTDLRSLPMPEASWAASVEDPHVPIRIAWSPTLGYARVDGAVRAVCERAVAALSDLGAEVVEVESVFGADPLDAWMKISNAYLLRSLSEAYGTELWRQVTPALAAQLAGAVSTTAVELVQAEDECHRLNLRLVRLFHDVRLLVTPTVGALAPKCGEPGQINGADTWSWVQFTYPFNMTRSPAGTVFAGLSENGLPVGLQLVGPQHGDLVVLRAMAALERALGVPTAPVS